MKLEEFLDNPKLLQKVVRKILLIVTYIIVLIYALFNIHALQGVGGYILWLLGPFLLGIAVAFVMNVILRLFELHVFSFLNKKNWKFWEKIRRPLCILLSFLVLLGLICTITFFIIPELSKSLKGLTDAIPGYLQTLYNTITSYLEEFNITEEQLASFQLNWTSIIEKISDAIPDLVGSLTNLTVGFANAMVTLVMSFIFSIYMLSKKEKFIFTLKRMLYAFLPQEKVKTILNVASLSNRIFSSFVRGQMTESLILGILCYIGLLILQLPYALLIASIIALSSLIPIIGFYIGGFTGALLLFLIHPMYSVYFIIFLVLLQQFEGNVIYPRVVGSSIGLPGIWVIFAIVVGGNMMGIAGILLGIPTCSVIYSLLRHKTAKNLQRKGITNEQVLHNDLDWDDEDEDEIKAPSSTTFGKLRMFFKRIRNKNTSVSEKSPENTQASDSNIPPESPSSIDVSPAEEQAEPENETPSSERDDKD